MDYQVTLNGIQVEIGKVPVVEKGETYSRYETVGKPFNDKIRWRIKSYIDTDGSYVHDYCIEIYKRPYFFHSLGKKCWNHLIQTSSLYLGLEFAATYFKKND